MSMKKVMALLLTGAMAMTSLNMAVFAEESEVSSEAAGEGSDIPLVVGINNFSEKFCMLFAESVPDQTIADLTGVYLMDNDRSGGLLYNGIEGDRKSVV